MHIIMHIIGILLLLLWLCLLQESCYSSYHYAYYRNPIIIMPILMPILMPISLVKDNENIHKI